MAANLELLNEALEADTAFDEIPVMYVLWVEDKVLSLKVFPRDMASASNRDPGVRLRLAEQIRDACMRVGFFYSEFRSLC
jgi:hypothetical protein